MLMYITQKYLFAEQVAAARVHPQCYAVLAARAARGENQFIFTLKVKY